MSFESRIKTTGGAISFFEDIPTRIYTEPRKEGELEIRSPSDVLGAKMLREREARKSLGYKVRKQLDIELPGQKPEKLINLAAQEEYYDLLAELWQEANDVKRSVTPLTMIGTAFSSLGHSLREVIDKTKSLKLGDASFAVLSSPFRAIAATIDQQTKANKSSNELKRLYHTTYNEYMNTSLAILLSERRDWQVYRYGEIARAFIAPGRIEFFNLGASMVGLVYAINHIRAETDRKVENSYQWVEGVYHRDFCDIAFGFGDWALGKLRNKP